MILHLYKSSIRRSFSLLFSLILLSGCAVTDRVSHQDQEGPVPENILHEVMNGSPSKAWVKAHLGEPYQIDSVQSAGDARHVLYEVYTYRFTRSAIRNGHVLFVFKVGNREDQVEYLHVAYEKGMMKKAWMDKFLHADLGTQIRKEQARNKTKVTYVSIPKEQPLTMPMDEPMGEALPEKETESETREKTKKKKPRINWKIPFLKKWFDKRKKEEQVNTTAPEPSQQPSSQAQSEAPEVEASPES